jgi:hypothetical protein
MKCNKTQSKWCINKHGASKIIDTFETYQVVAADATADVGVTAEARPAWTKEASTEEVTAMEVIAPRTTTDQAAVGETAPAEESSGPAGQEEPREVIEEAMKDASAGAEILEPPEVVAQASSRAAPASGTKAGTPVPGTEIEKAADPPRFRIGADPEKGS